MQFTGTDVLFLSHTGLKSLGRTIQEKSMPISSLSGTITKDIISLIKSELLSKEMVRVTSVVPKEYCPPESTK